MGDKYIRTSLQFEHLVDGTSSPSTPTHPTKSTPLTQSPPPANKDPAWMPYFLDFLSRHDQSHLLLFWLEVEVFELAAGGGPSLVTQATRIFESYLGTEAPKRIDMPADMLAFAEAEVMAGVPNINVFAAAHAFVYRRLRQTWYPAFLLSSTYQSLLEHLKQNFRAPLKEILIDEIQSRYIEAFLLNTDAKLGPATVGNVYLWKKIHHDLRPLGTRLARDRLVGAAGVAEDLRLFIGDAKAAYEAYVQPSPKTGIPGGPPLTARLPPPGTVPAKTSTPSATALGPELRHRIAECLGRLVSQSRYYSGVGTGGMAQLDRNLIHELITHFIEAQRVILLWLEVEVYPHFQRSWLCGVLSGDIQSRRSAPLRRKRRLRTLFKSVRSFRHVYVPPCPRSEGRGLVLVSTEGVSPSPPPLTHEFVFGFDVAVSPAAAGAMLRASDLRTDLGEGNEEEEEEEAESLARGKMRGMRLEDDDEEEDMGAVGGAILSTKGSGSDSGIFQLGESPKSPAGSKKKQQQQKKRLLQFQSAIRHCQVMALPLPKRAAKSTGDKEEEEARATKLCAAIEGKLTKEIQRLAFPSLCLMPLERSTFVLFSPKLVVPDPTLHHFVLPVARKDIDPALLEAREAAPPTFLKSPRATIRSPSGDGEMDPPDLTADDVVYLYGACLMEWAPAGDEVLLPRCLALVSTEPRVASLRMALLALREAQGRPGVGGSPITPDTPKKTPWQLEDEQTTGDKRRVTTLLDKAMFAASESRQEDESVLYWQRACASSDSRARPTALFSPTSASMAAGANPMLSPTGGMTMTLGGPGLSLPPPLVRSLPQPVDASFLPLFHALSPETMLKAVTAVLLERPVIVKSASRSLTVLASEGLRRLIYPFAWLRCYQPLLPVGGICAFWDDIRRTAGGRTWFDYAFEDDGLDDSLVGRAGRESYTEPMTTSSARTIPGFLVGLEACIVEAALTATKVVSPAYHDEGGLGGTGGKVCHAWACATCEVHDAGMVGTGAGGFEDDSPFSPGRPSPLSTRSTPRTTRESSHTGSLGGMAAAATARSTSTTKYGELPACVRASVREVLSSAYIVDLDRDCVVEPRKGDAGATALPPLPDGAAAALLTSLQRVANPTVGPTAAGEDGGASRGYGYRTVCAAREAAAAATAAAKESSSQKKKKKGVLSPAAKKKAAQAAAAEAEGSGNVQLHGAFVTFFRRVLLDRYREYTLSYLEEQMVAFHADSFLASQPEPTHGFWTDLFQTSLFAHFLLLEHQRVAASFEEPPVQALPAGDTTTASKTLTASSSSAQAVDV